MQDVCHWVLARWLFNRSVLRLLIWSAFSSKNFVLNFSMFASGMGLSSLAVCCFGIGVGLASSTLGGMCRVTGEWYELRLWSLSVVDVYRLLFGVLM